MWRMPQHHPAYIILGKSRFCRQIKCSEKKKKKSHVLAVEVRFSGAELHKFSFIRWNTKENLKKEIHLKRLKELHKTSFSFGLSSCKKILTAWWFFLKNFAIICTMYWYLDLRWKWHLLESFVSRTLSN